MNKKRKSCPVNEREFIVIENFNEKDKNSFNGTETVRGLNKFTKKFFSENKIVVLSTSKSFQGKTFVVPFIDKEGKRYWISDPLRRERLHKEKLERQAYLLEQDKAKKELKENCKEYAFNGYFIGDDTFLVDEENFIKIKGEKPSRECAVKSYANKEVQELYKLNLLNLLEVEKGFSKCEINIKMN